MRDGDQCRIALGLNRKHCRNFRRHTLGKLAPQIVGEDVVDQSGNSHRGVVAIPIPILSVSREKLKMIREQLYQPEFSDLIVVDFSDVAQSCKNYPEYIEKAEAVTEEEITYFGIGIYGSKKRVNKLTGDLPLLR